MDLSKERIFYLLKVYISKQASFAEENELMDWILEAEEDTELRDFILEVWNQQFSTEEIPFLDWENLYARVISLPFGSVHLKTNRMRWLRWTAAAAVLAVTFAAVYFYIKPVKQDTLISRETRKTDIAPPSGNKAILTLSDGRKIDLDSRGSGIIAQQDDIVINKETNGEISYTGDATRGVSYNTLSVPRGSTPLNLTLADGSKVWLNVASSITYPTAFIGRQRKVSITGEAYFEVAHNEGKPFKVETEKMEVEVLGTHFNVNSYDDELSFRTTLLEGSIIVKQGGITELLKPGQQAKISRNGDMKIINDANLEEAIAWKEGKFQFDRANIHEVMRQLARWYDVSVDYNGDVSSHFGGSISRNVHLSQVLKMLELTGEVKFQISNKHIIVMP